MIVLLVNIFILLFCGIMIITHITLIFGILNARKKEKTLFQSGNTTDNQRLTLIIPVRDEEKNLPALFQSLENQRGSDFEILFVDDRSEDNSPELLSAYKAESSRKISILRIEKTDRAFNPKQYALSRAIHNAEGEILLFTDADCRIPPQWVDRMKTCFSDSRVGLVFAPVHTEHAPGFLKRFQVFDHLFRYFYTVGCAGIGNATGGFGNNLSIRRETLESIGGYDSIGYSPTEDAALISSVRKKTDYMIVALTSPEVTVTAKAKDRLMEISLQQLRWSSGAIFSDDPATSMGYLTVMIFLMAGTTSLFLLPLYTGFVIVFCSTFISMSSIAAAAGIFSRSSPGEYWTHMVSNILFAMVYYYGITVLTFFKRPILWKGQRL